MRVTLWKILVLASVMLAGAIGNAETLPATAGEALSGRRLVLADAVRGHAAILVVAFTKQAGDSSKAWAQAIRADSALAGLELFSVAMLGQAPGLVRGMIKSSIRKGLTPAEQDSFVVITQDEKLWRRYLNVIVENDTYVVLLDAAGQVRWQGHGQAKDLEPLLRIAKH